MLTLLSELPLHSTPLNAVLQAHYSRDVTCRIGVFLRSGRSNHRSGPGVPKFSLTMYLFSMYL